MHTYIHIRYMYIFRSVIFNTNLSLMWKVNVQKQLGKCVHHCLVQVSITLKERRSIHVYTQSN